MGNSETEVVSVRKRKIVCCVIELSREGVKNLMAIFTAPAKLTK